MRAFGSCDHELDQAADVLVIVGQRIFLDPEEADRELLAHVDIHADELAAFILEVPGRVGCAGSDDDLAAIQHPLEEAVVDAVGCARDLAGETDSDCARKRRARPNKSSPA